MTETRREESLQGLQGGTRGSTSRGARIGALPWSLVAAVVLLLALWPACDGGGSGSSQPAPEELFSPRITQVVLEVDYGTGAEPYTGSVGQVDDLWALFRTNADRIFQGTNAAVNAPNALDEMEELVDVVSGEFTVDQILDIADRHRDLLSTRDRATFYVVFLPGFFSDETGVRENVLGVSIGQTGIIALFKPVIESTHMDALPAVSRFVEQSTLIHEFGHAVGLVNNGLPMAGDHEDSQHPAHCLDHDCVMYYANEGPVDLVQFVRSQVTTGQTVLFCSACLADIEAQIEASR